MNRKLYRLKLKRRVGEPGYAREVTDWRLLNSGAYRVKHYGAYAAGVAHDVARRVADASARAEVYRIQYRMTLRWEYGKPIGLAKLYATEAAIRRKLLAAEIRAERDRRKFARRWARAIAKLKIDFQGEF